MKYHYIAIIKMFIGISFILLMQQTLATTLTATTNRSNIRMGESIELTITLKGTQANYTPDVHQLDENYYILSSGKSTSYSVINNQTEAISSWHIIMKPKHTGNLTIPAFKVAGLTTQALNIHVAEPKQFNKELQGQDSVFMQATATPENPYVNAESIYTLKLFYSRAIQRPHFTEPKASNVTIYFLGREKNYSQEINGVSYQVLEQRYAIIPNKSGILTIKGPILTGNIIAQDNINDSHRQLFSNQNQWESFSIAANDVQIKVNAKPAIVDANDWIPSSHFEINSKWSSTENKLNTGQPLTLKITMHAEGIIAEQLPDLKKMQFPGFQVYPDKAELDTTTNGQTLLATRTESIALIPQNSGEITIPAYKIAWWNTNTNTQEYAEIPSKTFTIIGDTTMTMNAPPQTMPQSDQVNNKAEPIDSNIGEKNKLWIGIAALFMVLWLITLILYWHKRQTKPGKNDKEKQPTTKALWQACKKACQQANSQTAKTTLLEAAKAQWPNENIRHLHDISTLLTDPELQSAIRTLEQALYTDNTAHWDGSLLWKLLAANLTKKNRNKDKQTTSLPPMYPDNT